MSVFAAKSSESAGFVDSKPSAPIMIYDTCDSLQHPSEAKNRVDSPGFSFLQRYLDWGQLLPECLRLGTSEQAWTAPQKKHVGLFVRAITWGHHALLD